MNIFIDTETSGMVTFDSARKGFQRFPKYTALDKYDTARVVSICWLVCQHDKIIEQGYYVIRPTTFQISPESQAIHGISQEEAMSTGVELDGVLQEFQIALSKCKSIVAHNIEFDVNVIKSECHRLGMDALVEAIDTKHHVCTMLKGREFMNVKKRPKLTELYQHLYGEELKNAHNALADTMCCFKCYIKMFPSDKSVFFFKDSSIHLTEEQQQIVYSDPSKHTLVIAAAGSGKTTTTLAKIKYMLDECNVDEDEIILTTFTRDAANDMKQKLQDILGYKPNIRVGTIDAISKFFTEKHFRNTPKKHELRDVGEHGYAFLELLREKPSILKGIKYLLVDEYQDINDVQHDIIQEFKNNGIIVYAVGDDAQNIYSFRGSNVKYIHDFANYFENSQHFNLSYNFRCSKHIVDLANACLKEFSTQKAMVSMAANKDSNLRPTCMYFASHVQQCNYVVSSIKTKMENGYSLDEICILSPNNFTLYSIEEALTKEGIPHVCLEGKGQDGRVSKRVGHVCLSTIHKAKGLEWSCVFLINLSDDTIPKLKNPKNILEDRRVFYVAITRPKTELYMSYVAHPSKPYVSRFISQVYNSNPSLIDFLRYKPEYTNAVSTYDFYNIDKSIDKMVELLDGGDFVELKRRKILPSTSQETLKATPIYDKSFTFQGLVEQEGMQADFSIFLKTLLMREIQYRCQSLHIPLHTKQFISSVVLEDNSMYDTYKKYSFYIKQNGHKLPSTKNQKYMSSIQVREKILEGNQRIPTSELNTICQILYTMRKHAEEYHIPINKVLVTNSSLSPKTFEEVLETSIDNFENLSIPTKDVLQDVWNISKCKRVVNEQRKRMLYKGEDITETIINENKELLNVVLIKLVDFILPSCSHPEKVICDLEFEDQSEKIVCNVDCIIDTTLYCLLCTSQDEVDLKGLVSTLVQSCMCIRNEHTIKNICIVNILRGWRVDLNMTDWVFTKDLTNYLVEKRQVVLEKNKV